MKIRRRARTHPVIPTASMADIAMLLLIFFMSTSIIQTQQGAAVRLPGSTSGQRVGAEETIRVSIGPEGGIAFNDAAIPLESVGAELAKKFDRNRGLTVSLYADARTPYSVVAAVLDQMKAARAPRVTLATSRRGGS